MNKNTNLIWRHCLVFDYLSWDFEYEWEIVSFSPAIWFFKSYDSVSVLLSDWSIEDNIPLHRITIKTSNNF